MEAGPEIPPDRPPPRHRAPRVQVLRRIEDIERIEYTDGLAAVEVPVALLDELPLVNDARMDGPRLVRLMRSIRAKGFTPSDPVICRIGMKGRWVVVDGGHRLTAAKLIAREFWTNLFGPKIDRIYFLLFTTPGSWRKVREAAADIGVRVPPREPPDGSDACA